jgi:hypothetical protein
MAQTVCVIIINNAKRERPAAIVADRNRPRKHVDRARIMLPSAENIDRIDALARLLMALHETWPCRR